MRLQEFSNKKLAQYKTAAAADATKADAAGDVARGHKRFKGINTATKKQFDNDAKKKDVAEGSNYEESGMYNAGEFGDNPRDEMEEGRKKKKKKSSKSLSRYFFPGFGYYGSGESGEGGGDGGGAKVLIGAWRKANTIVENRLVCVIKYLPVVKAD